MIAASELLSTVQVLLRDVQMHPFRQQVLHVDFQRVSKDKKIHMKVPLHFVNGETSPAVTAIIASSRAGPTSGAPGSSAACRWPRSWLAPS